MSNLLNRIIAKIVIMIKAKEDDISLKVGGSSTEHISYDQHKALPKHHQELSFVTQATISPGKIWV